MRENVLLIVRRDRRVYIYRCNVEMETLGSDGERGCTALVAGEGGVGQKKEPLRGGESVLHVILPSGLLCLAMDLHPSTALANDLVRDVIV